MRFNIGERVVHPHHGIGYVSKLEEMQFGSNASHTYYVIVIADTTLWVPVDLSTSGLRKLSIKSDLDKCRKILQSTPLFLKPNRGLLGDQADHIKQGTITAHCEVVRDLAAYGWHKSLYGTIADFQQITLQVLCQEWAIVEELSLADASDEIYALLKKCRTTYDN